MRHLDVCRGWAFATLAVLSLVFGGCDSSDEAVASEEHSAENPDVVFGAAQLTAVFTTDGEWRVSPTLEVPDGATRVGVLIDVWEDATQLEDLVIQGRGLDANGNPGPWGAATVTWSEHPHVVARAELGREYVTAQMRIAKTSMAAIAHITWSAVIPEPEPEPGVETQGQGLSDSLAAAGVASRAAWNARKSKCTSNDPSKYRMAIHHTVTPTTAWGTYDGRLRSIQAYHMDTRGWCDIGYHFLISADGKVWEGRPIVRRGAHVGNHNTGNIGVSFVGCFHSSGCSSFGESLQPPEEMVKGAAEIVGALAADYGISITSSTVKGHTDHSGASTTCPGSYLAARLDDIRSWAKSGVPSAPEPTPTPGEPSPEPQPSPGATGKIMGVVWDGAVTASPNAQGNVRLVHATVSVAGVASTTVRSGDAFWKLTLPAGTHTLRVEADGYTATDQEVKITANATSWGSVGLLPATTERTLVVVAFEAGQSNLAALVGPFVHVSGVGAKQIGASGSASFTLKEAQAQVSVYAAGYAMGSRTVTVPPGQAQTVYVALSPGGGTGSSTLQGVVWDRAKTSGPSDPGNLRLSDALILCSCGQAKRARAGDAFWSFAVPSGAYTLTAIVDGYAEESSAVDVGWNASRWASIGVVPAN